MSKCAPMQKGGCVWNFGKMLKYQDDIAPNVGTILHLDNDDN